MTDINGGVENAESILGMFTTNTDAEKKGKWIAVGPAKFLLARAGGSNVKFEKAVEVLLRPHQRRIQMGQMSNKEAETLTIGPFVDAVLLGWENVRPLKKDEDDQIVFDDDGKPVAGDPITFNKENAVRVLSEHRDLFRFLLEESQRISNFAPEFKDAASGN